MAIATQTPASHFLRRVIAADAAVSGAAGLLQLSAAEPLSRLLAIDAGWLRGAGVVLMFWLAFLGWVLSRRAIGAAATWTIIGVNLAWIAASVLVLVEGVIAPNSLGLAFVLVQAAAVAVFAELQFFGLRRQQRG
ncbi:MULTISPECIES: hypothetical protein [unclassified Lysobacter]|uniref:hypothetical protein n=1 Tax=unclassified Lysobacter TaxID=2635362 RepID=UPI001BECE22E|nr:MULTISPECIES: hypothetical protein [unclassified Lysobacter]MBT2747266.1 hypothetical protein [Lysobacter sp. ISL-42]MBT2753312.1 hypothetical protein [Lysobacter sp. ISL-50]MBT2775422.1 hypothetical protein [Lysobacter sp. ISL-54]MBT2783042.1 hypothetical protein [Lysobacter sp. ISL-52]